MVLAAQLQNLVEIGSFPGAGTGTRADIVFTSSLRTRLDLTRLPESMKGWDNSRLPAAFVARLPKRLTRSVTMGLNAKTVEFQQPKRFSKVDTRDGSVFFHFTDDLGRNEDVLTVAFKGNTGDISLVGDDPAVIRANLARLVAWHQLWYLTREPQVLPDGKENVSTISYVSKTMPVVVELRGFFNRALTFPEEGQKPSSLDYSFEFTVQETFPPLDDLVDILSETLDAQALNQQPIAPAAVVLGSGIEPGGPR